jgi:hypothetical protein
MTNLLAFNQFALMGLKSDKSSNIVHLNSTSLVKKNAIRQFHSKYAMMEKRSFPKIAQMIAQMSYKHAKIAIKLTHTMDE